MYRWAHFGLGWSDVLLRSLLFQTESNAYWFNVLRNMTQFIKEVYSKCTYQNITLVETLFLILIKPSFPGVQVINSLLNLMSKPQDNFLKTIKVSV